MIEGDPQIELSTSWADTLPVAVFVVSPAGELVHMNQACVDLVGRDVAPAPAFPWRDQVNLADRARFDLAWKRCLDGDPLIETCLWTSDADVSVQTIIRARWVTGDQPGQMHLLGVIKTVSDVELSTADWSIYAAMVDNSPDATLMVAADASITWANPAAAMLLGVDEVDLVGRGILEMIHPHDLGLVTESFAEAIVGGPKIGFVLIRVRHRTRGWIEVEAAGGRVVHRGRPDGLLVTCREVWAREANERTTDVVRSRFEKAFDRAPIGMALISVEGRLVRVNEVLTQMVGRTQNDLTGRSLFDLAHPDDRDQAIAHATKVLSSDVADSVELRFVRPNGSDAWARITSSVIHDDDGVVAHGLVHVEDITEQRQLREQLEWAALRDPLTGVLNRAGLAARYDEHVASGVGSGALMLIDLDGFKAVNDAYGHLVGDDVLCAVADRLLTCLRADSVVARIGGDEFAIYLPDVRDAAAAVMLGERVRSSLADSHEANGHRVFVAGSVGIALLDGAVELTDALAAADLASYTAKRAGGNSARLSWRSAGGAVRSDESEPAN